jgi:hypothetical protein
MLNCVQETLPAAATTQPVIAWILRKDCWKRKVREEFTRSLIGEARGKSFTIPRSALPERRVVILGLR